MAPERFGECIDEEAIKNDSFIQSGSSNVMSDSDDEDYHDPSFVISSETPTPLASSPDVKNLQRQVEPPFAAATNLATTEPVGLDREESLTADATNSSTITEPVGLLEKGNDEQDLSITPPVLEVLTQDIDCMSNVSARLSDSADSTTMAVLTDDTVLADIVNDILTAADDLASAVREEMTDIDAEAVIKDIDLKVDSTPPTVDASTQLVVQAISDRRTSCSIEVSWKLAH